METAPRRLLLCWIYILSVAGANGEQVESAAVYEKDYFREKKKNGTWPGYEGNVTWTDGGRLAQGRRTFTRQTRDSIVASASMQRSLASRKSSFPSNLCPFLFFFWFFLFFRQAEEKVARIVYYNDRSDSGPQ